MNQFRFSRERKVISFSVLILPQECVCSEICPRPLAGFAPLTQQRRKRKPLAFLIPFPTLWHPGVGHIVVPQWWPVGKTTQREWDLEGSCGAAPRLAFPWPDTVPAYTDGSGTLSLAAPCGHSRTERRAHPPCPSHCCSSPITSPKHTASHSTAGSTPRWKHQAFLRMGFCV